VGRIELPKPFRPNEVGFRDRVIEALKHAPPAGPRVEARAPIEDPLAACPDLHDHIRWAKRARKAEKDLSSRRRRLERLEGDLVRELEATLNLLSGWGFTGDWSLTDKGHWLRTIYSELDLLIVEAATSGLFDGLSAPDFAALASVFVYEARGDGEPADWPQGNSEARGADLMALWKQLTRDERAARLSETRLPDPGFAAIARGWADGLTLEELFGEDQLAAGDFVRTIRQLLDLLRQLRDTFPALAETASDAIGLLDHGVVSAGGIA
jgi:ATP-dependent RNA helicase HelY